MSEVTIEQKNIDERLKDMFRRLIDLYELHAQERQLIIKEKEEVNRLVQLLVCQTKEIGQYEEGIRKRIQSSIKESADVAAKSIEQAVIDKLSKKVDETCMGIDLLMQSAKNEQSKNSIKIIGSAILCGVFTGLLVVWIFMPK